VTATLVQETAHEPARATLATKTLWSGLASLVTVSGGFLCNLLIARLLGVEGTGRVAYLVWLGEIGTVVFTLGLAPSLTRYLAELGADGRDDGARGFASWAARRYASLALLGTAGVVAFGPRLTQGSLSSAAWAAVGALFLGRGLEALYRAYLTGQQRFGALSKIAFVSATARITGVGVGAATGGVTGALLGYLAGSLAPALLGVRLLAVGGAPPPAPLRARVWRYSVRAWIAAVLSAFVWTRMELFFLEHYWNAGELAMFTVGLTLASVATTGPLLLGGALTPHFAERHGAADHDAVRRGFASATRVMAALLFPVCFGLAALVPVLLPALFGAEFAPAVPNAVVLVLTSALAFGTVGSSLLYGLERSGFMALTGTVGAVLACAGMLLVVPAGGSWGAVWVRAALQVLFVVWGHFHIARLGYPVPVRALGRTAAAAAACALAAFGVIRLVPAVWALAPAIVLGAVVYAAGLRALRALVPEDLERLRFHAARAPAPLRRGTVRLLDWIGGTA